MCKSRRNHRRPSSGEGRDSVSITRFSTARRLADEKEFGGIIVKTGGHGQVTLVAISPRVELAAARLHGQQWARRKTGDRDCHFTKLPGSNALATSDAVRKKDG